MEFVVDMQCFQSNDVYFIKELAIVPLSCDEVPEIFLFDPPFSWSELSETDKISNRWLERNHHGIPWSLGGIPQSELSYILFTRLANAAAIYVKGQNKVEWLRIYVPFSRFNV